MRRKIGSKSTGIVLALVVGIVLLGFGSPAEAGDLSFALGASFAVGNVDFHVAYASPHSGYLPYYYRTAEPLRYHGYACGPYCVKQRGYWYHGPACPLVLHHFSLFGFAGPGYYVEGYGAPYRPYAYGPAPGHYRTYYRRGYSGHRHRGHGYSRGHHGKHGGYGYFGYHGGSGYHGKKHGRSYGKGHHGRSYDKGHHGRGRSKGHHRPGAARRTRPGRH